MLPDRVSNPGPLTYESGALPAYTGEEVGELIREKYCTVKKSVDFTVKYLASGC